MVLTLVAVATAVVAATTGYLVTRKRGGSGDARRALPGRGGGGRGALPKGPKKDGKDAKDAKDAPEAEALTGLPLTLGDVIVSGTEERWLAGALVAREKGRVVSALFLAPEGATTRAVVAFALPKTEIFWLDPTEVDSPAEPPATLEIAGAMLTRRSRLPVVVERLGQGAPRVGDSVLWATYEGGGREVAVVLVSEGRALAWMGRRLDADEYDRLGSGGP
jgi:hypothetical protein